MNEFYQLVYEVVANIPMGSVVTYGQIASFLGSPRSVRSVVWALHGASNKDLPFHRVVNRKGELAPDHIFGSKDFQRELLEDEGVTFKLNGCIDLARHLWDIDLDLEMIKNDLFIEEEGGLV